jgi:hypothetical protein
MRCFEKNSIIFNLNTKTKTHNEYRILEITSVKL